MLKKLFIVACCVLATVGFVHATQQTSARDLYLNYPSASSASSGGGQTGRPGSKVQIERNRNGNLSFVSPKATFLNGDKIAFRTSLNFSGYLTVINLGTSGKITPLYSGQVTAGRDIRVPAQGWITVAGPAGKEVVNFIMSTGNPFQGASIQPTQSGNSGSVSFSTSTGQAASDNDIQSILNDANARALSNGRDLVPETQGNDTYVLTSSTQSLSQPVGFSITLNHE